MIVYLGWKLELNFPYFQQKWLLDEGWTLTLSYNLYAEISEMWIYYQVKKSVQT